MRAALSISIILILAVTGQFWAVGLLFVVGLLIWLHDRNKKKQAERDRLLNEILEEIKKKPSGTTYNLYKIDNHQYGNKNIN